MRQQFKVTLILWNSVDPLGVNFAESLAARARRVMHGGSEFSILRTCRLHAKVWWKCAVS